jgi:histidinol-phosphate aminotransferase
VTHLLHPQARPILKGLHILKQEHPTSPSIIDFTNSTNPYGGQYTRYPSTEHKELKELYLKVILGLESKKYPSISAPALSSANVLFTVGSVDGLDILLKAFCEPNQDSLGMMSPSFSAYAHYAKIYGLTLDLFPLFPSSDLSQLDVSLIAKKNPKMILLCTPNNPTGTHLNENVIPQICEAIDGLVVVDEAYIEYADQPSSLQYLSHYKNLIILRTLSKAWGMAGLRCGVVIADPLVIQTLYRVQTPFPLSTPSEISMNKQLSNPDKIISSWEKIKQDRDYMSKQFLTLPCVGKVFKSHSNFIFLMVKPFEQVMSHLKERGLYVADCSHVFPNAIKVSICRPSENRSLLKALRSFS